MSRNCVENINYRMEQGRAMIWDIVSGRPMPSMIDDPPCRRHDMVVAARLVR
jgi:hypothetical protein